MARPVAADAAQTRARILAQASVLFARDGQGSVSVRKVAEQSGVSLATVHHYFGTKARLYDACVASMHAELEDLRLEMVSAFADASKPEEAFEEAVRRSYRFARDRRGVVRLLMRTVIDTGKQIEGRLDSVHLPFLEQAGHILTTLSQFPAEQLRLAVQSIMHLVVRYALTDPAELQAITNTKSIKAAQAVTEDHLVWTVRAILGLKR